MADVKVDGIDNYVIGARADGTAPESERLTGGEQSRRELSMSVIAFENLIKIGLA